MDGIPEVIWRDFPHPNGPNLGGRDHIPFTSFETILARQILSCSLDMRRSQNMDYRIYCRQDVLLACNVGDGRIGEQQRHPSMLLRGYEREEDIVGTSGHKTLEMNDAFVELPVVDDDASTNSLESDVVQVQNPSFFSHRATVEDLITSFRRNTIGPLAGVEIRDGSADDSRAPVIIVSDKVSQRTLDCALEKWRVEQEEKELEMRWRATKRVSENWLTKVELVREKHRARREKFEREREKRKAKAGGGATTGLAGKGPATSQGNNRGVIPNPHPHSVLESQLQPKAPLDPEVMPSQLPVASNASHAFPLTPQSTNYPAFSYCPLHSNLPSSHLAALPTPVRTDPHSSTQPILREYTSPVSPKFPHTPYDPRTPDLALEELAHIPLNSGQPNHLTLLESATDSLVSAGLDNIAMTESLRVQEEAMHCVQQYIDLTQMSHSPLPPHCVSPSQNPILPTSHPPSTQSTLPEIVPESSSVDSSAHCIPQDCHSHTLDHSFPNQETLHLSSLSVNPTPMIQDPLDAAPAKVSLPSDPTAEEKMLWHVWSLTQAPPGTAADVILRNPQVSHQSNLAPMLFNLFPSFKGNKNEAARVKLLTGSSEGGHTSATLHQTQLAGTGTNAGSNWTWVSHPSTNFSLDDASVSSVLAPRAVLINPAYLASQPPLSFPSSQSVGKHTASHDLSTTPPVPPSVSTARPTPVLKTQDLPPSLPPWSHVDSPMSPTSAHTSTTAPFAESSELSNSPSALYPQYMPLGNRLFRIARVADADVLRPSYWFEPDIMATERMRNVVNLMERSGGWRRPERRTRLFDGDRKAHGPDDLASFDLCFGY